MLQNDVAGMAALDEPIKAAEQAIDGLKTGLSEVMGANVHGASGNQLTGSGWFGRTMGLGDTDEEELRAPNMSETPVVGSTKPGLDIGNSRPLFAANDIPAHVTELGYPWELGYPVGSPPVEGPPPSEDDMGDYEKDVEESLSDGETGLNEWWDKVSAILNNKQGNNTESLPKPEPQAQPSEFVREEEVEDPKDVEKREKDFNCFQEALGGLADFSEKNNTDDISTYVKDAIEKINSGEGIDKAAFFQTNPYSNGSVYVVPMEDADVELEVLNQEALPQYGGNGTELQEMIDKVWQLFGLPFGNEVTTVLGVVEGAIEDHYNPGQILQPGDTRITVTSLKPIANQLDMGESRYTIDYFFRGSDLLYSKDNNKGEIVWGGKYKQ